MTNTPNRWSCMLVANALTSSAILMVLALPTTANATSLVVDTNFSASTPGGPTYTYTAGPFPTSFLGVVDFD